MKTTTAEAHSDRRARNENLLQELLLKRSGKTKADIAETLESLGISDLSDFPTELDDIYSMAHSKTVSLGKYKNGKDLTANIEITGRDVAAQYSQMHDVMLKVVSKTRRQ